MSSSSRFAVALHILTLLATHAGTGDAMTSARIAGSVNTNPVVIRRILGSLRRARLVRTSKGARGGFSLAAAPTNITLLEVLRSTEPDEAFHHPRGAPNPRCPVGCRIHKAVSQVFFSAQAALEQELARTTLADLASRVTSGETA